MNPQGYLDEVRSQYRRYRTFCERAAAQVEGGDFFAKLSPEGTSIAVIMKHLAGNHRSRWRDFLSTDGEKADRHRDREFLVEGETRETIEEQWREAWRITLDSLDALGAADLERTVTIRGEPHSVVQALERNLTHLAYHAGQVVFLARHFAGAAWQTLSIPPGRSEEYNESVRRRFEG